VRLKLRKQVLKVAPQFSASTKHHKFSDLKQHKFYYLWSVGQTPDMVLTGPESRCGRAVLLSGDSRDSLSSCTTL
jgi:hypothetical protein